MAESLLKDVKKMLALVRKHDCFDNFAVPVDHTVITDYRDVVTVSTSVRDIASQARKLKYYNLDLMLVSG